MVKTIPTINRLAEQAGFVFWTTEEVGGDPYIDWASEYDHELTEFFKLVVQECIFRCQSPGDKHILWNWLDSVKKES